MVGGPCALRVLPPQGPHLPIAGLEDSVVDALGKLVLEDGDPFLPKEGEDLEDHLALL